MSRQEISERMKEKEKWYGGAQDYWKKVDPSVNGMLQGYEAISDVDAKGSTDFLNMLKAQGILTSNCCRAVGTTVLHRLGIVTEIYTSSLLLFFHKSFSERDGSACRVRHAVLNLFHSWYRNCVLFIDHRCTQTRLMFEALLQSYCGAGIGRVSKHFLMKHFEVVDIVELCEKFTNNIHEYLNDDELSAKVGEIFNLGLQDFNPQENYYDVIWIQWVIGHLTDDDCVAFFQRCKKALHKGGCIILKDNIAKLKPVFDENDSSVTRSHNDFQKIFKDSGLRLHLRQQQEGFPHNLFPVNMYALT